MCFLSAFLFFRNKKHRLLLINKGRCSHRGTTLFQSILRSALIPVQSSAALASGLPHTGLHAFRRKAPILKVPEGSCGMLSAGGAPSLTHYIFCTHICSQPESVLVLHRPGVLSSCRFSLSVSGGFHCLFRVFIVCFGCRVVLFTQLS